MPRTLRRAAALLLLGLGGLFFVWPPGEATVPATSHATVPAAAETRDPARGANPVPALAGNGEGLVSGFAEIDSAVPPPLAGYPAWLRVVDTNTGEPVAGALVMLGAVPLDSRYLARGGSALDALFRQRVTSWAGRSTDAAGRVRVIRRRLRREPLTIRARGYAELREPARLRTVGDEYRVALRSAPVARVRVVDEHGTSVPSVRWDAWVGDTPRDGGVSGDRGEFEYAYEDVALALVIAHPGCAVVCLPAELPGQTITLVPGEACTGRVVDADGQPLADCTVRARSSTESRPTRTLVTGDDGLFFTRPVARDGWVTLEIEHADFLLRRTERIPRWSGVRDVQLTAGAEVVGTVYDAEGGRLSGATVRLVPGAQRFYSRDLGSTSSASDGGFRARWSGLGQHWLVVEHDRYATAFFDVECGGEVETRTVAAVLGQGRIVHGSVGDEQGEPVAGVRLQLGWVCGDEIRGPIVETDERGEFLFFDVPPTVPALRPALRDRRWAFLLDGEGRLPTDTLLIEVLRPHELLRAGHDEIPGDGMFGSRNTTRVGPHDRALDLIVHPTDAVRVPLLALTDGEGREVRTLSNLLIVPRDDIAHETDIVFGGLTGNPVHLHDAGALEGCLVVIISRRYAVGLREIDAGADRWPLPVTLHELRTPPFELRVEDTEGVAVAGAALFAAPYLDPGEPFAAIYIGHTDDRGMLRLRDLPPGHYRIGTPRGAAPPAHTRRFTAARAVEELQMLGSIRLQPDGPDRAELIR